MGRENAFIGTLLILIGCLLFAARYMFGIEIFHFRSGDFWPIIVLAVGLVFESVYFITRKAPGLLVPGGIITVIGMLFFFEVSTGWRFAEYTWPVYLFAVAFGLLQLYMFAYRSKGLLVPVFILSTVGAIAIASMIFETLISWFDFSIVIPVVLILAGLVVFFGRSRKSSF